MNTFFFLFFKILPFCFFALTGFITAKAIKINFEKLAKFFIYVLSPPVFFYGALQVNLHSGELFLPVIYFITQFVLAILFLFIGKRLFKDGTEYLLALTVGINNVGNMGIPLTIAILGPKSLGPTVLILFGSIFYSSTIGFFLASKGHYNTKEAFINTLKLPTLYAFMLGILLNAFRININYPVLRFVFSNIVNFYSVAGLFIAGVGIASIKKASLDKTYLALSLIAAHIAWPLAIMGILFVDMSTTHLLTQFVRKVFFLESLMPIGINVISYAALTKIHPDKGAVAVAISTILSLIYIPIMLSLFLPYI